MCFFSVFAQCISFNPISNREHLGAILNLGKLSKAFKAKQQEAPGVLLELAAMPDQL